MPAPYYIEKREGHGDRMIVRGTWDTRTGNRALVYESTCSEIDVISETIHALFFEDSEGQVLSIKVITQSCYGAQGKYKTFVKNASSAITAPFLTSLHIEIISFYNELTALIGLIFENTETGKHIPPNDKQVGSK